MPNSVYFEKYNNLLEVLRNQGINLSFKLGTLSYELNNLEPPVGEIEVVTEDELEDSKYKSRAKYTATAFLNLSDHSKYGTLLEDF